MPREAHKSENYFKRRKVLVLGFFIILTLIYGNVLADPSVDDAWRSCTDIPTPRGALAAAAVNGKIYAIGGVVEVGGVRQILTTVEEYDPVTDTWRSRADMPTARWGLAAAVVNGKIYAIGGVNNNGYLKTVEEYDPSANIWRTKTPMAISRGYLGVAVVDTEIYAIGGLNADNRHGLVTVTVYDPANDKWHSWYNLHKQDSNPEVAVVGKKIYVINGWAGTMEETDPHAIGWISQDIPNARIDSITVVNEKIYGIGGLDGTVKEYDPATDTWHSRAPMPTTMRHGIAVVAVDGKIYAFGGSFIRYYSPTMEEYDPP